MPTRSALAGAATTAVVVAALGNPAAVSAARDADDQALGLTLTGFASWEDVADRPADVVATVAVRLGVTLVLVVLLCGLAGRARSRSAAFLGAWGALAVAAATGGALAYVHQVAVVLDGRTPDATYRDGLVLATNAGAAFGTWTGWLVGAAVALATRPATAVIGTEDIRRTATTTASQRITEPPPPWWAPTRDAGDDTIRPGPTAFPPGGLGHEVRDRAAGGDEHADATASLPAESDRTLPLPRPPD